MYFFGISFLAIACCCGPGANQFQIEHFFLLVQPSGHQNPLPPFDLKIDIPSKIRWLAPHLNMRAYRLINFTCGAKLKTYFAYRNVRIMARYKVLYG